MATWRDIAASETDPLAPIVSALMKALAANPVAIAEGATGAPRIRGAAVARPQDLPVLTVTAADTVSCASSADVVAGTTSTTSGSDVVAATYTIRSVTGTVRMRATHTATGNTSRLSFWKNGVEVAAWNVTDGTATRTADIAVVPTDVLEIRHRRSGVGASVTVSGMDLTASDGYVERTPFVRYSERNVP